MAPRDIEVARVCERVEVAAATSLHDPAADPGRALGLAHLPLGSAVALCAPALDVLRFNRVLGLGSGPPAREADLDSALAFFRAAGAKRCMAQVAPIAEPATLGEWLERRGFRRHNAWLKLHRDAAEAAPAPDDPRVVPLPRPDAGVLAALLVETFGYPPSMVPWLAATHGRPGWSLFGAYEDGALAAGGGLFIHGDAAWLGLAATRPASRGRGLQTALIARRIEAARAADCRHLVVETALDTPERPNPSTHNLRRMGFRDAYERVNWVKVLAAAERTGD